jgi:hypothetical protein
VRHDPDQILNPVSDKKFPDPRHFIVVSSAVPKMVYSTVDFFNSGICLQSSVADPDLNQNPFRAGPLLAGPYPHYPDIRDRIRVRSAHHWL